MKKFDWVQFHKDLDIALATWITEEKTASIHRPFIDFLEYSHFKQQAEAHTDNLSTGTGEK